MPKRNPRSQGSTRKSPPIPAAGSSWRHALQDLESLLDFANLRPKAPEEFAEAISRLSARPAAGSVQLHSPASIALLKALGGTALNAPLRFADIILFDPRLPAWRNANAQKRVLPMILRLRECTFRILDRLEHDNSAVVNGVYRPELDPKSKRIDFAVNGREPIDILTFGSQPQFQLPIVYDVQDALFARVRNLIDRVQRPVRLRCDDDKIIPYWPLSHCIVCGRF